MSNLTRSVSALAATGLVLLAPLSGSALIMTASRDRGSRRPHKSEGDV